VSLVVTYRPEDVPADSLLLRLSSRPAAGSTQLRLGLGPLDVAGTAALVSSMLAGEPVSEEFAGYLHEHTDGLPLAVEESVRLLRDRRDLRHQGGVWVRRRLDELAVPPTVRDAVLERTRRLSPSAQVLLRNAAVLADPVQEATLLQVCGLGEDAAVGGLTETLGSGLLVEDGRRLVAFRHVLACRAVYDAIPAVERHRLHLRAGPSFPGGGGYRAVDPLC
jgi:predicted ATPase